MGRQRRRQAQRVAAPPPSRAPVRPGVRHRRAWVAGLAAIALATVAALFFALRSPSSDDGTPLGAASSESSGRPEITATLERPEIPEIVGIEALDRSFQAAVDQGVAAVRRDPTSGEAYGRLGQLYHSHGYFALARRAYEIASRLDPRAAAWPYYLGVLASGRGQSAEAVASLRRALALDPDSLPTYLRLGNLLFADGELDAAEQLYATLVVRAPQDPWGYLGRGKIARRQGRLEQAAELLEQAVDRAPDDREGAYLLAMTYRELGRIEPARRQLDRLGDKARDWPPDPLMEQIRSGRHDLQSMIQIANRMLAAGDSENAETLYRAVLDSDPGYFDALYNLGVVYSRQGRLPEAESMLQQAIRGRPDRADAHFALAVTYASGQQLEKAAAEIAVVLRLDPEHEGARALLAGQTP